MPTITVLADSFSVVHDQVLTATADGSNGVFGVLHNDSASDPIHVTEVNGQADLVGQTITATSGATFTLNIDGSFVFVPAANSVKGESFAYTATDDTDSASASITINVTNIAPVAVNDTYSLHWGGPVFIAAPGVLGNDSDANGDSLKSVWVSAGSNGYWALLSNGSGALYLYPDGNFVGQDTLTYKANDGVSDSNTATVTINVTDTAPIAEADSYSTDEDSLLTVSAAGVLANDSDADTQDSVIFVSADSASAKGAVVSVNSDGSFTYDPNSSTILNALAQGVTTTDTFGYTITDGALSSQGTVTITVTGVNDAPVASADFFSISHDLVMATQGSMRESVLQNDTDADGDPLTAVLYSPVTGGTLSLSLNGHFVYTPINTFVGEVTFAYRAFDGTEYSSPTTVTINLTNSAPTDIGLSNHSIKIYDAQVGTFTGLDNDYLESFSYTLLDASSYPDNSSFTIQGDQVIVTDGVTLSSGTYTIQVQATDGGGLSTTKLFVITVESVTLWIDSIHDAVEGESTGYFRLRRSSTDGELTAAYTIDTDRTTAAAGIDYASLAGSAEFVDGQEYADIIVDACGIYDNGPSAIDPELAISLVSLPGGVGIAPAAARPLAIVPPAAARPPLFTGGAMAFTFYVGEGTFKGTRVGNVVANPTNSFQYSITGGNTGGYFAVSSNGQITVATTIPLTETGPYSLSIRGQDVDRDQTITVTIILKPLLAHPTRAYLVLWIAKILSLKNS